MPLLTTMPGPPISSVSQTSAPRLDAAATGSVAKV